ncbi:hypothetical protein [Streptomyces himalayensis]|uniref:hypothetical protein n=1 Tax=Streptomyces himalayensis TaxID=2820085 RepID=UPI001C6848D9|nr:hypothetical protein [Streptomyces himalayensis]
MLGPVPPQRQFHGLRRRRAYRRDQDVFDPGITVEDNLSLIVDYASGASMTYALNAHSPWEGYVIGVNGTKGRAELTVVERGSVTTDTDGHVIIDPRGWGRGGGVGQRGQPLTILLSALVNPLSHQCP